MQIECNTDGMWTPVKNSDQPPMGTLCRFGGSGHLSAIYECILGSTLEPADIAGKCGLSVWAVKDLLQGSDSDLSGDYAAIARVWRYGCQVRDYLEYAGTVLDMSDEVSSAVTCILFVFRSQRSWRYFIKDY